MRFFPRLIFFFLFVLFANPLFSQTQVASCPLLTKTVAVDGSAMSYLGGGHGESILLLHGLFAQKEQWLDVGCALASQGFEVLAPDLPGYGASSGYPVTVYALDSQVDTLHKFMLRLGKDNMHIAGSSMGGTIAALYAQKYPGQIKSLAFIGAPLGIIGWSPQVRKAIFEGVNPFIPINQKQFDLEMHLLFFKPPKIDEGIKAKLVQEYVENNRHYQQVWDIVNFYDRSLGSMEMNTPRTLILWGEQDGIFSIDGLPLIKEVFKNSQAMRFPDAAHLLMLEQPKKVVRVYGEFLRE
jgi:pimeloyl-ACP methyl ester carboxylesterase